jgi:hypothetical protein
MPVAIDHDVIEQLARAMLGQLSPLSGTRAAGSVVVTNPTGAEIRLPRNAYLVPVVEAEAADDLLFKTCPNPDTLDVGGAWSIPALGQATVGITSNLGGARHNLAAGSVLRFDPPLDGVDLDATLVEAITGGVDSPRAVSIRRAVYYEELLAAQVERDILGGRLAELPGVMLVWQGSAPAEGRSATTNQGSTRIADGLRAFVESYRLFVVDGSFVGDRRRRSRGLRLLQAITRLLTDQQVTADGERLSDMGSLEFTGRDRFVRDERHYVYSLSLRVTTVLERVDSRVFVPFLRATVDMALPGREAPEPTEPLTVVDVDVDIPTV